VRIWAVVTGVALPVTLTLLPASRRACAQDAMSDNVVVVLDASGSMHEVMRRTRVRKMDAAKAALREVLARVPETTHVGLLVFSARNIRSDWVYPLGPRRDEDLARAIGLPEPGGQTPLGAYIKKGADRLLQERAKQLGYGTYRLLIVTDGEAQDRALVDRYAPEVVARGITVDVVGVDMRRDHTLATRVHSYRSADDPDSLKRAVAEVFAEVGGSGTDVDYQEAFDELSGIPDVLATEALKALSTSGNHPIGQNLSARTTSVGAPRRAVPARSRSREAPEPTSVLHVLLGIALLVGAGVAAHFAHGASRVARLIEEMPTTPIGSVRSGLVEVKGKVSPASEEMESPYTNTPCVYYHFQVVEGSGNHRHTIINDRRSVPCQLEDETGSCQLDVHRANMVLDLTVHGSSGVFSEAPERTEAMLRKRYAKSSKGWVFNKSMSYTETALRTGTQVYVLGTARPRKKDGSVRISKRQGVFIVSDKSERQLLARFRTRGLLLWLGAAALGTAAAAVLFVPSVL
jgi:hypothetical protein